MFVGPPVGRGSFDRIFYTELQLTSVTVPCPAWQSAPRPAEPPACIQDKTWQVRGRLVGAGGERKPVLADRPA